VPATCQARSLVSPITGEAAVEDPVPSSVADGPPAASPGVDGLSSGLERDVALDSMGRSMTQNSSREASTGEANESLWLYISTVYVCRSVLYSTA